MKKFSPRELVKRAAKRYSVSRGVLADRRRRAHADGLVTRAEADAIHEQERKVADALKLLRKRKKALPRGKMNAQALELALKYVGTREVGGNNIGPVVSKIIRAAGGTPGEPWCGDFVAFIYLAVGASHDVVTRAWAYVPSLERVLRALGASEVKPGDIVTYNWAGGVSDHTGLFRRWIDRSRGIFEAVEGNTRLGTHTSDAGGGEGVEIRERSVRGDNARFFRVGSGG